MRDNKLPRYINFNILDDLEPTDIRAAQTLASRASDDDDSKIVSGLTKISDDYDTYQVDIPLPDTIGLQSARRLCNSICYILELSDEVLQYTEPTFYSKYPHMKKLGVPSRSSDRTACLISFFVAFRCKSIRELDRLFRRLDMCSVGRPENKYVTVIDFEGSTGMYIDLDAEPMEPLDRIYNIAYLLGFSDSDIDDYTHYRRTH